MTGTIPKLVLSLLQIIIAFGLMNVWLIRFNKSTQYRGGNAKNMTQEFAAYGLPAWSVYVVGFLKMVVAAGMIVMLFVPQYLPTVGLGLLCLLSMLMVGAISMHIKVHDRLMKTIPAITVLTMTLLAVYLVSFIY